MTQPTSRFVEANGLKFHCLTAGDPKNPLILLLHGFPEFSFSWRYQIEELAQTHFVVAPDLRGYGKTDKPQGRASYQMPHLEDDIYGLIQALGYKSCVLIGHDWGGGVAWAAVDRSPELFEKLVVMNCPHPARFTHALLFNVRQVFRSWYMFFFQLPVLPELWLKRDRYANIKRAFRGMTARPEAFPKEVLEAYAQNAAQPGALTAMLNYYRAMFSIANLLRKWKQIPVPTLILWGEQDQALGVELLAGTERYFPNLVIRKIPNASHWVQQDAPEEVNARLKGFLAS